MAKKPSQPPPVRPKKAADTRTQKQRFIDFAREHGADDPDALDKAFGRIVEKKPAKTGDGKKS